MAEVKLLFDTNVYLDLVDGNLDSATVARFIALGCAVIAAL